MKKFVVILLIFVVSSFCHAGEFADLPPFWQGNIFQAYATSIVWFPEYFPVYITTTTVVRFPNGSLGYIVLCAIPLQIIIDENVDDGDIDFGIYQNYEVK